MRLKRTALLLVLVMIGAALAGCTPAKEVINISIATGGTGGTYFPLGGALASVFNDNIEGAQANAESTGASLQNVTLLMDGTNELAFIQNDITYYAFTGTEMYAVADKGPQEGLRGVATWYPEIIQIVARADANINTIGDLKGKKVAVGAPGSGTEANARQILGAYNIAYTDLAKADYLSFAEAADQLKDGLIDAAFVTAGIPTGAITDVAISKDIKLIPFDDDRFAAFSTQYPFYTKVVVPAGTYNKQTSPVTCVAVMAMLVTHADVDEDLVYKMTKAIFENLDDIAAAHARGADLKLETAQDGMPIELHPGAKKYFDEQ